MNTTTKRYPRTLASAFPRDARHAYAIERVSPPELWGGRLLAVAIGIAFGVCLYVWAAQ